MTTDQTATSRQKSSVVELLIYLLIWPVLILSHLFILGFDKAVPHFWEDMNSYFSTVALDFFIIVVWYLNYYLIVPRMIRKRQFAAYMVVAGIFMLGALFLQTILFYAFKWGIPSNPFGTKLSLYGPLMVLSFMAVGLSVRGVINWLRVEDKLITATQHLQEKDQKIEALQMEIKELSLAHDNVMDSLPEVIDVEPLDDEKIDNAYDDLGIDQGE